MRLLTIILLLFGVATLQVATPALTAQACPGCSDALGDAPDEGSARPYNEGTTNKIAEGFAWSILMMLAIPAAMLAGLVFAFWQFARRPLAVVPPDSVQPTPSSL